ncbi:MAG: DNA repair exonuclease [Chloroflexota bacterium]|nr:DNA repair exonuclease [Chloroflexota bacterium]
MYFKRGAIINNNLRILATSDVHIGAFTDKRSPHPNKCMYAFKIVVDKAIEEKVDLVLIAGDFFDHNRIRKDVSDYVLDQLARLPMPTVILPGNHDPLDENSVYWRMDLKGKAPKVHLITTKGGETVSYPELDVAVWGKPHVSYDDIELYPLKDPPKKGKETWQLGIGHGHFIRDQGDMGRSYPIEKEEIAQCDRDYVALGHWDAHMNISQSEVVAYYVGSPTWVGTSSIVEFTMENGGKNVKVEPFPVKVDPPTETTQINNRGATF